MLSQILIIIKYVQFSIKFNSLSRGKHFKILVSNQGELKSENHYLSDRQLAKIHKPKFKKCTIPCKSRTQKSQKGKANT